MRTFFGFSWKKVIGGLLFSLLLVGIAHNFGCPFGVPCNPWKEHLINILAALSLLYVLVVVIKKLVSLKRS